jgi:DNA uptake protein ComE-like DNA-binding protein
MKFLMTLPKCGEKTARAILEKFWNIKNFVNASDDQILQIPGVGPKLLEKWRQVLGY